MELNKEQIEFLDARAVGRWSINKKTGLVDIEGDCYCNDEELTDFKGVRFGVVTGDFDCSNNKLTSLEGAPQVVGGSFYCFDNKIKSLEGAPKEVGKYFNCSDNKLTSLEGAPQKVGKTFYCSGNKLTSLGELPQEFNGDFYSICTRNNFPFPNPILELVFKTMQDKGVNYYRALFLNKKAIEKEINKHRKKIEKLESVFVDIDAHMTKDEQKGFSMLDQFGHFE